MAKMAAAGSLATAWNYNNAFSPESGGYFHPTIQTQHNNLVADVLAIINRQQNTLLARGGASFADGTTAGKIKTVTGTIDFCVNGEVYSKAATDDFWDLSAETDTAASKYRAYWLYINASLAASFGTIATPGAGDSATAAAAVAALLAAGEPAADKAVVGVFIAGPSTDMSADAIVAKANAEMHYGFHSGTRYVPTVSTL